MSDLSNRAIVLEVIRDAKAAIESREVYLQACKIKPRIQYSVVKKYLKKLTDEKELQRVECNGKGPGGKYFKYALQKQ